ncbi:runt-related transcription factor 1 isoform X9 [Homo sapiens]|uniref:runt-related transcription factor 1 isoform X9 n=1 Tax=Homo sapiens TaxID=9606 RepID=UPI0023DE7E9B|nr:runt-related transcription factor 1 isoform X9 [Homo sapiens]
MRGPGRCRARQGGRGGTHGDGSSLRWEGAPPGGVGVGSARRTGGGALRAPRKCPQHRGDRRRGKRPPAREAGETPRWPLTHAASETRGGIEPRPGRSGKKHPLQKPTQGKTLRANGTRGRRPASCKESAPLRRSCQPDGAGARSGSPGPRGQIAPPPWKRRPGPGRPRRIWGRPRAAAPVREPRGGHCACLQRLAGPGLSGCGAPAGSSSGRRGLLSFSRSPDRGHSRSRTSLRVAAERGPHAGGAPGQHAGLDAGRGGGLRLPARAAYSSARRGGGGARANSRSRRRRAAPWLIPERPVIGRRPPLCKRAEGMEFLRPGLQ